MTRSGRIAFRAGPLRAAAALAAVFIVARVVYRILFDGASGSGPVLLPLPTVPMPPPFGWVRLLGPVTLDGLGEAIWSAIPVASVILAFGVVNALVDLSRVFARLAGRGPLRGIARALALAWSTLPALSSAVRRVRTAQQLRGEKSGPRLLIPVLERTLERAAALASGLELRGLGGTPRSGDLVQPVIVRHAQLGFADHHVMTIGEFTAHPGTVSLITGPTGSGKSTFLRAVTGLLDHVDGGWSTGTITVVGQDRRATPPQDTAHLVGVVLQNPREAFCGDTVRDEIGVALQLRAVAAPTIAQRVDEVAAQLGLTHLLDRAVHALSAGEATLVAIAAAMIEQPAVLVVDEPLADLDARTREQVVATLAALAHITGLCVIVAEHRWGTFETVTDAWWRIDTTAHALVAGEPLPAASTPASPHSIRMLPPTAASIEQPALQATGIRVIHGDTVAVHDADITLTRGEIAALIGPNAAGKSSLLMALALPEKGARITGHARLVPDASDDLFTYDTVAAECARADRLARRDGVISDAPTADVFAQLRGLTTQQLHDYLPRHPLDLSVGERRCLAIALQLARHPDTLLVDEPTRGLDNIAREQVRSALTHAADSGIAVLLATHDHDFATSLAARTLHMHDGTLSEHPKTRERPSRGALTALPRISATAAAPAPTALPRDTHRPSTTATIPPRPHPARSPLWMIFALTAANLVALAAFTWPLLAAALPSDSEVAAPWAAFALAPIAVLVALAALDESVRSAHTLAYLGVLAAIGTAVRIASTGVGGVEAVFILLILAGRVFGARFGLLLGVTTIAVSSTVFGGFGPWTPFQMFACAWVGAGAGLLPRTVRGRREIVLLCAYGVIASYLFGLIMNLWFWPFAIGGGSTVSYVPGAPIAQNLGSFLLYSLAASTSNWDTLRAITTVVGIVVIGRPVLAALRRAKPLTATTKQPAPQMLSATRRK